MQDGAGILSWFDRREVLSLWHEWRGCEVVVPPLECGVVVEVAYENLNTRSMSLLRLSVRAFNLRDEVRVLRLERPDAFFVVFEPGAVFLHAFVEQFSLDGELFNHGFVFDDSLFIRLDILVKFLESHSVIDDASPNPVRGSREGFRLLRRRDARVQRRVLLLRRGRRGRHIWHISYSTVGTLKEADRHLKL